MSSVTLTGKQIKELALIAGFGVSHSDEQEDQEDLFEAEYYIGKCPEKGILDEGTGEIIHSKYMVTEEACAGDGEGHPL